MKVELLPSAEKDLRKLGQVARERILRFLVTLETIENPRKTGRPLAGSLADYWRYRVGDYRIICHIEDGRMTIVVVRVGHRKDVYSKA